MTRPTDERPPSCEKDTGRRATQEQADGSCTLLRHPAATRQSHAQTSARLWIGATWIVLIVETQQSNARGVCVGHQRYATRTKDPYEDSTQGDVPVGARVARGPTDPTPKLSDPGIEQ
jgi:hypothetical protein